MRVIGITGGSGAGKSLACRFLRSRGGLLIDCDKVYASLVDAPSECTEAISKVFGAYVLHPSGALDRKKLSEIVFNSKEKLALLNSTVHPIVIDKVKEIIRTEADAGIRYFLIDAPQLFEAGADAICDCTVYVTADKDVRIKRIRERDGISEEAAERRIASQLSDEYFRKRCTYTITNNGTEKELEAECSRLLDLIGIKRNG